MKRKKLQDTSYWPGYVDALVNVVLNILFLVGLMAVGLITLNIEALGNFKSAKQAEQMQKISEDNLLLAALGTLLAVIPTPPSRDIASKERALTPKAAPLAPSKPEPKPEPVAEAELKPIAKPPVILSVGQPFVLLPVSQEQAFVQAKAGLLSTTTAFPSVFEFGFLQYKLSDEQITSTERQKRASAHNALWSIFATVPSGQERVSREAFLRMSSVRQVLIEQGVSADAITMRTITQDRLNFSNGRRVLLYSQTRAAAAAN